MGIEAIYQKPNTSLAHPAHKVYPYLLRGLLIDRPNQVWCADITYVPMAKRFVYLVAVMDWFSRRVLSWRVSITMDSDFCVAALREAMEQHGRPEIFNTDQGVQFTSADFLAGLEAQAVRISMDGKGRYLDNIFIERLLLRPRAVHRYSDTRGTTTCVAPLASRRQVLTFRTKACIRFTPSLCRSPLGQ
jgi:putative transposase